MSKVLVLDNANEPLNICDWKRAASLITTGKATVLEELEEPSSTGTTGGDEGNGAAASKQKRATVIRLKRSVKRPQPRLSPSRRNIFHRDNYTCRYCKARGKGVVLTLDHVTPRCQGGKNSWENLATSCFACNNKKGGRNLEESGMVLTPVPPRPAEVVAFRASMFRRLGMSCPSWDKYLPTAS